MKYFDINDSFDRKELLVADIIHIGDNKNLIRVIDENGEILFDGRMEDASYQSNGHAHHVVAMKILFLESIDCVTLLYVK